MATAYLGEGLDVLLAGERRAGCVENTTRHEPVTFVPG